MAYITSGYVDNAIGTNTRLKVAPTTAAFSQYESQAREMVKAAAEIAGISLSDTTTSDRVKFVTLGQWVKIAYGLQKGLAIPAAIEPAISMLRAVEEGRISLGTPTQRDGIGGVQFSSTVEGTGRPQRFGSRKLRDDWF